MATSNTKYAGRLDIEEVFLLKKDRTKADLKAIFVEYNISASIANPTAVVDFIVHDGQNLMHKLPIEVGDSIQYTYTENDQTFTRKFVIFKIKDIRGYDSTRSYCLRCHSQLFYTSLSTKISRSFKGPYSDIALAIFQDYTDEEITAWEPSTGNRSFIVPYWTPVHTISTLASKAISSNANATMKFFQNTKTRYCFSSLEFLSSQQVEPVHTYTHNISTTLVESGAPNSKNMYSKINDIVYHDAFSFLENIDLGVFSGVRSVLDLTTKTQDIITYDYWRDFDKDKLLNTNKLYRNDQFAPTANKVDIAYASSAFDANPNNISNTVGQLKVSSLRGGHKLTIVVDGNSVVDVGSVVNVRVPTPEPQSSQAKYVEDKMWSGNYMVIAKRDMHQKESHSMTLTLMKDSFIDKDFV